MFYAQNLTFSYDQQQSFSFPAIELEDGADLLIIGSSGVGKSTLLHLLARLLPPATGKLALNGVEYGALSERELDKFRGQQIGIIFQKAHFIASISVIENLLLIQQLGVGKSDKKRALQVLQALGISNLARKQPANLSQGQQQRLCIAMAVVNKPKLLLADEPTASLDDGNCIKVIELLKSEAKKNGANLIVITHDQRVKEQFSNLMEL